MSADLIVDLIIAVFIVFMVSLSSVAWWSSQAPKAAKTRQAKAATAEHDHRVSA